MTDKAQQTLSNKLKELRGLAGLTLRQVEEATGISNGYLSQLENEKIKKPSANALYKLASLYGVNIDCLLHAAGMITDENYKISTVQLGIPLTPEEEDQLIKYLNFLRWGKKH